MQNLIQVRLHGHLGEAVGELYQLAVNSVAEAIRAVEVCSKHKLYKYLYEKERMGAKYQVLINESPFLSEKPLDELKDITIEDLGNSELKATREDLQTIDIVPVLEVAGGGDGTTKGAVGIVLGVLLIAVGALATFVTPGLSTALIIAGIGLVAAGVTVLLSKPPAFEDFREISEKSGKSSYLFSGPLTRLREGGPIPVGYGRLIIGGHVISTTLSSALINADQFEESV